MLNDYCVCKGRHTLCTLYTVCSVLPSKMIAMISINATFEFLPPEAEQSSVTSSIQRLRLGGGVNPAHNSATWELLLQSVLVPSLCAVGIVGNALNIFVLSRQRMRRSVRLADQAVHVGLVGLAVSDMLVCLLTLPRAFLPEYKLVFDAINELWALYYQIYSTGLITTFSLISTWLIVATAGARYIATFHPLQSRLKAHVGCQGVSGRHTTAVIVLIIYVVCTIGNLPSFFLFRAISIAILDSSHCSESAHCDNSTADLRESSLVTSPFQLLPAMLADHPFLQGVSVTNPVSSPITPLFTPRENLMYIDLGLFSHDTRPGVIFHWGKSLLSIFIPGILLTYFNIRLIQALRQSEKLRDTAPRINCVWIVTKNRLNVTLIGVIVMFVCLVYPCELLDFVVHLTPFSSSTADREALMLTRMFLNALQLSNFALNFFLYCTVNVQFRKAVTDWFCHRSARRFDHNIEMYQRAVHIIPQRIPQRTKSDKMNPIRVSAATDADKVSGSHASISGARNVQHQSGSRCSHGNGRRS